MDIKIKSKTIEVPTSIQINDKKYPITQWNVDIIRKYWNDGDEKHLDELKDFALDFN